MAVNINLDDSNAWDDSALTDSWNEAVREYKKYHSIHVKGPKALEELANKPSEDLEMLVQNRVTSQHEGSATLGTAEMRDNQRVEEYEKEIMDDTGYEPAIQAANARLQTSADLDQQPKPISEVLLSSVQDENLRNLMMSWYWAGYYTGFHDGQKKVQAPQPS